MWPSHFQEEYVPDSRPFLPNKRPSPGPMDQGVNKVPRVGDIEATIAWKAPTRLEFNPEYGWDLTQCKSREKVIATTGPPRTVPEQLMSHSPSPAEPGPFVADPNLKIKPTVNVPLWCAMTEWRRLDVPEVDGICQHDETKVKTKMTKSTKPEMQYGGLLPSDPSPPDGKFNDGSETIKNTETKELTCDGCEPPSTDSFVEEALANLAQSILISQEALAKPYRRPMMTEQMRCPFKDWDAEPAMC